MRSGWVWYKTYLTGNVKKRLNGYFKKEDTCKLPKLHSDFRCEEDGYFDLTASTIGYEIPGNVVVYKMLAVKNTTTFLKDQLETKKLKQSLEWLAHEQLCHEVFAPRAKLGLIFKFEICRCSEKHKIKTFKLQHWFETDLL